MTFPNTAFEVLMGFIVVAFLATVAVDFVGSNLDSLTTGVVADLNSIEVGG